MRLKTALLYATAHNPGPEDTDNTMRAVWRFAFGVMQPKSVKTNDAVACECTSPDVLMADCPWHGTQAQRICFSK